MEEGKFSVLFHDILGDVSVVRNVLHFLLMGKTGKLDAETKHYLEESLKKCDALVTKIEKLREEVNKK